MAWRLRLHGRGIYGEPVLSGADLDALARLATRRGRPDGQGWPGVECHLHVRRAARHVELDGAWFGNITGLPEAVDSVAAAYLLTRGSDAPGAIERVRRALDGGPIPFLCDALAHVERSTAVTR